MRILAVADTEDSVLYEHMDKERWRSVELIVSCGDVDPEFLDYLVSSLNVPLYYVRGNHDLKYALRPPEGCENLHGRIVEYRGLRLAGLEGARWYGGQGVEYSERDMAWKTWWLGWRARLRGPIDVFVAHAPPWVCPVMNCPLVSGIGQPCVLDDRHDCGEAQDLPHRGFAAFRSFVSKHHPRYFLHGHTHLGYHRQLRERRLDNTRVIDCYGHYVIDVEALPRTAQRS